jgi:hypothetical protein
MRRRGHGSAISKLEEDDLFWHDESKDVHHGATMTNHVQMPATHVGVRSGQMLPHVPQLLASVCLSTQPLPQQSGVVEPHTCPHDPQLFLSVVVSLHALPQHVGVPPLHALKHAPQF